MSTSQKETPPKKTSRMQTTRCLFVFTCIRPSFVPSGNIVKTWGWLSGGPTLSCFGPVYRPQCVPPTFISSSSPLYTSSATQISPRTSPTQVHLDIWATRCTPISCSLPCLKMPLLLDRSPSAVWIHASADGCLLSGSCVVLLWALVFFKIPLPFKPLLRFRCQNDV